MGVTVPIDVEFTIKVRVPNRYLWVADNEATCLEDASKEERAALERQLDYAADGLRDHVEDVVVGVFSTRKLGNLFDDAGYSVSIDWPLPYEVKDSE